MVELLGKLIAQLMEGLKEELMPSLWKSS